MIFWNDLLIFCLEPRLVVSILQKYSGERDLIICIFWVFKELMDRTKKYSISRAMCAC